MDWRTVARRWLGVWGTFVIGMFTAYGCGDGGVDIGSVLVDVKVESTDAIYDTANISEDVVPLQAVMYISGAQYGVARKCGNGTVASKGLKVTAKEYSAKILLPDGAILPPLQDVEIEGYYLCWVRLIFRANDDAPSINVLAKAPDGNYASYISNREIILEARAKNDVIIEDYETMELALRFGIGDWLTGVRGWTNAQPWVWIGGLQEEILIRKNIAAATSGRLYVYDADQQEFSYDLDFVDRSFSDSTTEEIDLGELESINQIADGSNR